MAQRRAAQPPRRGWKRGTVDRRRTTVDRRQTTSRLRKRWTPPA
jgi:hypothetical protein